MLRGAAIIALLVCPASALADEVQVIEEEESPRDWAFSSSLVTPLAVQMGTISGEYNFRDTFGFAAWFGAGPVSVDTRQMSGAFESETVLCVAGGPQFRWYAWGDFDHGFFAGTQVVYTHVNRDTATTLVTEREGLYLGPMAGYKYTFDFGLMLEVSLTAAIPLYYRDGLGEDEVPGSVSVHEPEAHPVPNLGVGWAL